MGVISTLVTASDLALFLAGVDHRLTSAQLSNLTADQLLQAGLSHMGKEVLQSRSVHNEISRKISYVTVEYIQDRKTPDKKRMLLITTKRLYFSEVRSLTKTWQIYENADRPKNLIVVSAVKASEMKFSF